MLMRIAGAAILSLAVAVPVLPAAAQTSAESFVYGQRRFRHACRPPLKYAAGACVRRCPAGYKNDGRYCRLRSGSF